MLLRNVHTSVFTATTIMFFVSGAQAQLQPDPSARGNIVTGSGTTNTIPVWTGTSSIGNSVMFQTGGNIGIGTTTPAAKLDVVGGNVNLEISSATSGNILKAGTPFLHNHGGIFLGFNAGNFTMTGGGIGIGTQALFNNTLGINNTAIGNQALSSNTVGVSNTAIGLNALSSNTTGDSNIAIGLNALGNNTTAGGNRPAGLGRSNLTLPAAATRPAGFRRSSITPAKTTPL